MRAVHERQPALEQAGRPEIAREGEVLLTHAYLLSRTRYEKRAMRPHVPLGPLYVAAALREAGYAVRFYDTTFDRGTAAFARYLRELRPALVGIHALETTRRTAFEMIAACRALGIPVVLGGPDPSLDPRLYLNNGATFVVRGEGEETINELLGEMARGRADFSGIAGLCSADGFGYERPLIEDLGSLPFPARDLVDFTPYAKAWRRHGGMAMQLSVSRGCPYPCSSCAKPVFGSVYRVRPAASVAEEMQFVKMVYRPVQITFTDDIFGFDREWIADFRREMVRRRASVPFECFTRVDLADRAFIRELKESGCFRIWYSVASGSQKVLERLRAEFNVQDIRRAAALTKETGIELGFSLTVGHPAETPADLELTRQLVRETAPDHCEVSLAYPSPGSRFYREVESRLLPLAYDDRAENDNVLTYRAARSQNYYDLARLLVRAESKAAGGMAARLKYDLLRFGYGLLRSGAV